MDGNKMAYNNSRFNLNRGGIIRTHPQSIDWKDEHRISYCISCSARIPRRPSTSFAERWAQRGVILISFLGCLGVGLFYLISLMGG